MGQDICIHIRNSWEIAAKYNIRTIIGSDTHDFMEMEDKAMELAREFAKELGLNVIESIF